MNLPKVNLKKGMYATIVCAILAWIIFPLIYDHFSEGAEKTKYLINSSVKIMERCTKTDTFLINPFTLSIDDSTSSGQLSIDYFFRCKNNWATVRAQYHHIGKGWVADSIQIKLNNEIIEIIDKESRK